ncbi:O-antigen ligase family protein [Paenibacillus sonchi]|uniref:O-antigen ligase family protein n=1 Tax=Paenibacillus sonchi TaxID=373687 RepID=UPI001E5C0CF6|nr:hypothetical protein [Paenibacillus sonchi]MCE3202471.1 hypothetical protein [Paenibacillus sonchi]
MSENRRTPWFEMLVLFLICAYFFNIKNMGHFAIYLLIPIFLFVFFRNGAKVKKSQTVLLMFSLIYTYLLSFYNQRGNSLLFITAVFPSILYYFGGYLGRNDLDYRKTYRVIFAVVFVLTAFSYLSVVTSDLSHLQVWRGATSIWGKELTATGIGTYLSLGIALLPAAFLVESKRVKLASLILFLFSVYTMFKLGSRTGVLIIGVSIVISFLLIGRITLKKIFSIATTVVLLTVLLRIVDSTFLLNRFSTTSGLNDPRFEAWKAAFAGLFKYPLGGEMAPLPLKFAHNMWLDVGFEAGIVPFLLLTMFTLSVIKSLFIIRNTNLPQGLKVIYFCLFTAFFITFSLEPIMEGWFYYFNVFCFFAGLMKQNIIADKRPLAPKEVSQFLKIGNTTDYRFRKSHKLLYISLTFLLIPTALVLFLTGG